MRILKLRTAWRTQQDPGYIVRLYLKKTNKPKNKENKNMLDIENNIDSWNLL